MYNSEAALHYGWAYLKRIRLTVSTCIRLTMQRVHTPCAHGAPTELRSISNASGFWNGTPNLLYEFLHCIHWGEALSPSHKQAMQCKLGNLFLL